MEVWIQPNRRPMGFALIPNAILLLLGALFLSIALSWPLCVAGGVCIFFGTIGAIGILFLLRLPRLGYENGELLVFLRRRGPFRIPIDVVECFFLGQGDSRLPKQVGDAGDGTETTTIVVRLAEAAKEWSRREDVLPSLGQWCDGYITIRGTWCEPIDGHLVKRLNERLVHVHRQRKEGSEPA